MSVESRVQLALDIDHSPAELIRDAASRLRRFGLSALETGPWNIGEEGNPNATPTAADAVAFQCLVSPAVGVALSEVLLEAARCLEQLPEDLAIVMTRTATMLGEISSHTSLGSEWWDFETSQDG
ncbi:hypothetical protein [Aeromicrobium sp. NPDC092404]|uniref:hypothetical protein n=1 Tax=Aeromicrobium sp. NPDC092404 TaxID=3154976 RepID=UPI003448837D